MRADRLVACVNALSGRDPAKVAALLEAVDAYHEASQGEEEGPDWVASERNLEAAIDALAKETP